MALEGFGPYLGTVGRRLEATGFSERPDLVDRIDADTVYHRRRFEMGKIGVVDSVAAIRGSEGSVDAGALRSFSSDTVEMGLEIKSRWPRGFGGSLVVYPVLVSRSIPRDVRGFVSDEYAPRHWAAFEFPVLVDLEAEDVTCYEATPIWGGVYYDGFRDTVRLTFQP